MAEEQIAIVVDERRTVTAIRTAAEGRARGGVFIYAPGAGSNAHDPFGRYVCRALAEEGLVSLRLQFPYMQERRRRPDATPVLETTWRAAIEEARGLGDRLIVGGRSMGGRIASQVVATGAVVQAVALFAYPLHPPGRDQWRDEHLPLIEQPVFFCSGTRDTFATPDELSVVVTKMRRPSLHLLDGADHGFAVLKSSGRTREDVWEEALQTLKRWLSEERIAP